MFSAAQFHCGVANGSATTNYDGKRTGKQRSVEICPESIICLKSCYLETAKLRAAGDLSLQT